MGPHAFQVSEGRRFYVGLWGRQVGRNGREQTSKLCDLCICMGPCAQKDLMLGLMLCCHHLEIFNNTVFELVFCK
jgi:hypothetical protein